MTLEEILERLDVLTPTAQRLYQEAAAAENYTVEGLVRLALHRVIGGREWACGYEVREDEATVWAGDELCARAGGPCGAALILLARMEARHHVQA